MTEELTTLAKLFRITALQLRRLAEGPIRHDNSSLAVIEGYFYKNKLRGAAAFPPTSASRRQIKSRGVRKQSSRLSIVLNGAELKGNAVDGIGPKAVTSLERRRQGK